MFQADRYRMLLTFIGVAGLVIFTSACGDRKLNTGHIHDSAVKGIAWETDTRSGLTGSEGEFQYTKGQSVSFSLGSIKLGRSVAERDLTIVDIVDGASGVTDNEVTNIARLLQSLDDDGDLSNGIAISEFVTLQATENLDFDMDPAEFDIEQSVIDFLDRAIDGAALTSAEAAQAHLSNTINALASRGNIAPIADAGSNQSVKSGVEVTLAGSGSDEDGAVEGHSWTKDSENTIDVSLVVDSSDAESFTRTFTAPDVTSIVTLTFILTVHDDQDATGTDEVTITVSP